ncbi:transposase [Suttonella ornithocola]|uniref:transposase n=1 Tax=Suttonella ornithocola TaxID=279832 RepID=UPI003CCC6C12
MVDATIIQSASSIQKKAIETREDGTIKPTLASKDLDALWTKKKGQYSLGYKKHVLADQDGYIEQLHVGSANEHESQHLESLLENLNVSTTVYANKGYSSQANRDLCKIPFYTNFCY